MHTIIRTSFAAFGVASLTISSFAWASEAITDDKVITAEIGHTYVENHMLPYKDITLDTENKVVHLHGHVKTNLEKEELVELAEKSDPRVANVDTDDLEVEKTHSIAKDVVMERRIKNKLFQAHATGELSKDTDVSVETKNGFVHLAGKANKEDMVKIINIVSQTDGVTEIDNHLHT